MHLAHGLAIECAFPVGHIDIGLSGLELAKALSTFCPATVQVAQGAIKRRFLGPCQAQKSPSRKRPERLFFGNFIGCTLIWFISRYILHIWDSAVLEKFHLYVHSNERRGQNSNRPQAADPDKPTDSIRKCQEIIHEMRLVEISATASDIGPIHHFLRMNASQHS